MYMEDSRFTGKINLLENSLEFIPDVDMNKIVRVLEQREVLGAELRLNDGRKISAKQRKKIFSIIADISAWNGDIPEYIRKVLTWYFRCEADIEDFSLSNVDMTTAKEFITYLINFCFTNDVPTRDTLLNSCEDIYKYLYMCLEHRKCAICNAPADIHHVDRIGMGRNRNKINHLGLRAIALCRKHHNETEIRERELFEENHIYGIKLDKYLCKVLKLNYKEK